MSRKQIYLRNYDFITTQNFKERFL